MKLDHVILRSARSARLEGLLAGVLLLTLAACTTPRAPDTLIVAQQREPMSLNAALENGASSTEWGLLLFSYMVKFDDRGKLVGDMASEVPTLQNGGISADGLTVTYHLRKGLRFADGQPLTARDCAYSINAINDRANNVQSRFGYDDIASADAPNAATCVLHLKRPFAPLLTVVLSPQGFPILPAHLLAKLPNFNAIPFNSQPVGAGPYRVVTWKRADSVVMEPNPYYYRGAPKIKHLVVRFVPDSNTAMNLLKTHEADAYFNDLSFADYPTLQGIPDMHVTKTPVNAVGAIIFNTQDPITGDVRVRQALATAIDVKSLVAKSTRGALDSHAAGKGLFIWAYDPKAYPDMPYDPARARGLLDAAGWKVGSDGFRYKDGKRLDVLFIIQAATPVDQIIGGDVASYERAVGANVSLKQFNVTQFVAPVNLGGPVYSGKFQMALYPFVNGDDPDTTDQFACANVPPNGYNKSRICDSQIDSLLRQGQATFDLTQRKAIYAQLERRLYELLPILLIYQTRQLNTFSTRVHGQTTSLSGAWWNAGAWTLR
jgi:peptide/nickel transport system substrate-binding protein